MKLVRVVNKWNKLSKEVVNAENIKKFKRLFERKERIDGVP